MCSVQKLRERYLPFTLFLSESYLGLGLVALLYHIRWSHDQEWEPAGMQHTLSDAPHRPPLQPAISVRGHHDHIRAVAYFHPLCALAVLRHSDDACCDVVVDGNGPGYGELEVCHPTGDKPLLLAALLAFLPTSRCKEYMFPSSQIHHG